LWKTNVKKLIGNKPAGATC